MVKGDEYLRLQDKGIANKHKGSHRFKQVERESYEIGESWQRGQTKGICSVSKKQKELRIGIAVRYQATKFE